MAEGPAEVGEEHRPPTAEEVAHPEGVDVSASTAPASVPETAPVPRRPQRSSRFALPWVLLVAVLVLAGGAAVVGQVDSPHIPGAGQSPEAFVISSARNTVNQKTADVTLRGAMAVDGQSVPLQGSGQEEFTQNAFGGTIHASIEGQPFVEKELVVQGHVYMSLVVSGVNVSQALEGKPWIGLPVPANGSSPVGLGNIDPASQIRLAEKQGSIVKFLGTSVIGGHAVSEYSITPRASEIAAIVRQAVKDGQFPASNAVTAQGVKKLLGSYTTHVWLDGSGLMRRQQVSIAGGSALTGHMDSTYHDFGTSIHIVVPPASQVVGYTKFLKDAASQSTTE